MDYVHLAANPVIIGHRCIQRCFVCGLVLADNLNTCAPLDKDGTIPTFPTWGIGHLIEVSDGNPTRYTDKGETERPVFENPWPGCCLELVEH